jgi:hypothetical protein
MTNNVVDVTGFWIVYKYFTENNNNKKQNYKAQTCEKITAELIDLEGYLEAFSLP